MSNITGSHVMSSDSDLHWREYLELTKPKVVLLIVFTAIVGMFLAVPGMVPLNTLIFGTLGIGLAAASAAAVNHVVDQKADARMRRTKERPLPSGRVSNTQAIAFATTIGLLSMALLVWRVNALTAVLTLLSLVGYAGVYTMYLKRATPQNIVIGGAAGAAPPVLGWTAVTGTVAPDSLLLFLIIFLWTPPHFWALAIHRRKEYAKAGMPMLPVTHGSEFTRLQIVLYTVLLVIATLLPFLVGMSGWFYLAAVLVLNGGFLYYVIALYRHRTDELAIRTFSYSIVYLMVLFAVLLIDHYLPY